MASCCCCIGLRTGCILIGLIFLIVDVAAVVWAALGLSGHLERPWPDEVAYRFDSDTLEMALWVALGIAGVSVLCDFALIIAAGGRRRCGQLLWLVWTGLLLFIVTLLLLALLGLSIWLLVDADAPDKLGLRRDTLTTLIDTLTLTEQQRREREQQTYLALLIGSIVGLCVISILWGWFNAVDRNQRRLRHTTVIVKTQHVHTSRL